MQRTLTLYLRRCLNTFLFQVFTGAMGMDATKIVTRVQLYDAVCRKVGVTRQKSVELTEAVIKELTDCLARGEDVKLSGFGTFAVRKKGQRLGRNPKTGVDVVIEPRRVIVFRASSIVKKQMNPDRTVQGVQSDEAHAD